MDFLSVIDEISPILKNAADALWDQPETAFAEFYATDLICQLLQEEGFQVEKNLAGISTAFKGSFGSGKPVIAYLGEYDALSGLHQESGITQQQGNGGNGHGCGHHLLGIGSLGAAIAVKRYLAQTGTEGTVVYFGCPGEEGGSGKAFMARDGVFDVADVAFCWHPGSANAVYTRTSLANCQVLYKFDGIAAHAATGPHLGRSALDAVELMNVGVNFLREHMRADSRIHYAITNAGGFSPNVVQAHSEVLYLIRSADVQQLEQLRERVDNIAKGAALMTGTTVSWEMIKACSNTVLNHTLLQLLYEKMVQISPPKVTDQDLDFAQKLTQASLCSYSTSNLQQPIMDGVKPYTGEVTHSCGSTDVGDVSWVCPTAQILTATFVRGTPEHSWQNVTQGKMPLAHNAMLYASKVLSAAAIELLENPARLEEAKREHLQRTQPTGYRCPIPAGLQPRAIQDL